MVSVHCPKARLAALAVAVNVGIVPATPKVLMTGTLDVDEVAGLADRGTSEVTLGVTMVTLPVDGARQTHLGATEVIPIQTLLDHGSHATESTEIACVDVVDVVGLEVDIMEDVEAAENLDSNTNPHLEAGATILLRARRPMETRNLIRHLKAKSTNTQPPGGLISSKAHRVKRRKAGQLRPTKTPLMPTVRRMIHGNKGLRTLPNKLQLKQAQKILRRTKLSLTVGRCHD